MTEQQSRELWCRSCDTRNPTDAAFCVGCGAPLAAAAAPPVPQPARHKPVPVMSTEAHQHCSSCGIMNPAKALYCVNCGASLTHAPPAYAPAYAPASLTPAFAGASYSNTVVQHVYVLPSRTELPIGIRALWFLFVGLWLGQLWLIFAWLLNLTLIGLPAGMWMLEKMPQVMTLRQEVQKHAQPKSGNGVGLAVRVVYFVLIGWWAGLIWLQFAWLAALTILGLPLSFLMFERTSTVMTLADA